MKKQFDKSPYKVKKGIEDSARKKRTLLINIAILTITLYYLTLILDLAFK